MVKGGARSLCFFFILFLVSFWFRVWGFSGSCFFFFFDKGCFSVLRIDQFCGVSQGERGTNSVEGQGASALTELG